MKILDARNGYTLVELLVYSAIFAMVASSLIYFLSIFFRGVGTHASTAELGNQANFILQTIEQEIAKASIVVINNKTSSNSSYEETDDTPLGTPYNTLLIKMRTENNASPPPNNVSSPLMVYRTAAENAVIKQGTGPEVLLNSAAVKVKTLTFTKVSTPPGRDVILINLKLEYQSANPAERITRQFTLGMGKAYAATFDTVLQPGANNALDIGTTSAKWKTLFLSGDINIDGKATWTSAGSNNSIAFLKQGMVNVDPPSINGTTSTTITITSSTVPELAGVQSGDRIQITPPTGLEDGLIFTGASAAANSITLRLRNTTGGAINGTAQNWSYLIIR